MPARQGTTAANRSIMFIACMLASCGDACNSYLHCRKIVRKRGRESENPLVVAAIIGLIRHLI
jgi:hypothetical protein